MVFAASGCRLCGSAEIAAAVDTLDLCCKAGGSLWVGAILPALGRYPCAIFRRPAILMTGVWCINPDVGSVLKEQGEDHCPENKEPEEEMKNVEDIARMGFIIMNYDEVSYDGITTTGFWVSRERLLQ